MTIDELHVFIGILLLSGYIPLLRRHMYWRESEDVQNIIVLTSIRCFEEISSCLHVSINKKLDQNCKLNKIRSLIESLNKLLLKYAPIEPNVSKNLLDMQCAIALQMFSNLCY